MRITTFNICGGGVSEARVALAGSAFHQGLGSCKGDILAVQEVSVVEESSAGMIQTQGKEQKQLALVSGDSLVPGPIHESGSQSIAAVCGSGVSAFQVLVIWAKRRASYEQDVLNTLGFYSRWIKRADTIVLGDFNLDPKVRGAGTDFYAVNAQLNALGLHSAYHRHHNTQFGQEPHPTLLFNWGKGPRSGCFHCDYIFLPESWFPRIKSVSVEPVFGLHEFSDHRAVTVELL